jgi:hypothetical protein
MRIFPFHASASAPAEGAVMEPKSNTIGVQCLVTGDGPVTATAQPKGRIIKDGPWEDVGDAFSISGTDSVSESKTIDFSGAQLMIDLTACSCLSFRCEGAESNL